MTPSAHPSDRPPSDIAAVAEALGLRPDEWVRHGHHRAEIELGAIASEPPVPGHRGRYVLVTGMTPTKAGEGKTVTSIGLAMGLRVLGHRSAAVLRQSSLGPTLGLKGGGAGGGRAAIVPLEEALLGLGADLFAIESANNLLAARVDDLLFRDDPAIDLDPTNVIWRRVLDMDDRALRRVEIEIGRDHRRTTGFDITAASEVMAVLSLATGLSDLRARLGRIIVGLDHTGEPVTAEDTGAAGAMAVLLRTALRPNLLQASDGTPVLVHGGPFANIAHGCSSIVADLAALPRADYVVTEAGFGADLGAVKFLDLKCAASGLWPDAIVLTVTVRAVLDHADRLGAGGDVASRAYSGMANVAHHVGVLRSSGVPVVVAVNRFPDDDPAALAVIATQAAECGAFAAVAHDAYASGAPGAADLAAAVVAACAAERPGPPATIAAPSLSVREKVDVLAHKVFGASGVDWSRDALRTMLRIERMGLGHLPVCVAKTHLSISHDPTLAGVPRGHRFPIRAVRLYAGAGFVTVYAGDILTMPAFGVRPRFLDMDVDLTAGPSGAVLGLA